MGEEARGREGSQCHQPREDSGERGWSVGGSEGGVRRGRRGHSVTNSEKIAVRWDGVGDGVGEEARGE